MDALSEALNPVRMTGAIFFLGSLRLGGGEVTRFVCGYFGCERHADRLFLAGLPPARYRRNRNGNGVERLAAAAE